MQKMGGTEALDEPYLDIPLFKLFRKRIGWLVVLFLGEMLTATAMGYFEDEIAKAKAKGKTIKLAEVLKDKEKKEKAKAAKVASKAQKEKEYLKRADVVEATNVLADLISLESSKSVANKN